MGHWVWRAIRLPPREVATSLHAALLMVGVELAVRRVSLPHLCRRLGIRLVPADHAPPPGAPPPELPETARRRLRCTWRVAGRWPFSDGPCLRRALVGGHLIRRLRPVLRLGVTGGRGTLRAHAWLEVDGHPLEEVEHLLAFHPSREPTP